MASSGQQDSSSGSEIDESMLLDESDLAVIEGEWQQLSISEDEFAPTTDYFDFDFRLENCDMDVEEILGYRSSVGPSKDATFYAFFMDVAPEFGSPNLWELVTVHDNEDAAQRVLEDSDRAAGCRLFEDQTASSVEILKLEDLDIGQGGRLMRYVDSNNLGGTTPPIYRTLAIVRVDNATVVVEYSSGGSSTPETDLEAEAETARIAIEAAVAKLQ